MFQTIQQYNKYKIFIDLKITEVLAVPTFSTVKPGAYICLWQKCWHPKQSSYENYEVTPYQNRNIIKSIKVLLFFVVFCVSTPSVHHSSQHKEVNWNVNNELKRMWKEVAVPCCRWCPRKLRHLKQAEKLCVTNIRHNNRLQPNCTISNHRLL